MNENEGMGPPVGGPIEQTEERTKRVFYAWLGALASAYDTAEDQYEGFVRRGREVAAEWQDRRGESGTTGRTSPRMRESFRVMMDTMMESANMPSKAEVDAINVKLNILMRKIDDLSGQAVPHPVQPETPPGSTGVTPGDIDLGT